MNEYEFHTYVRCKKCGKRFGYNLIKPNQLRPKLCWPCESKGTRSIRGNIVKKAEEVTNA